MWLLRNARFFSSQVQYMLDLHISCDIVQLTSENRMTSLTGRTTRVIGWYHSHPHITVLPSHVGTFWLRTFFFLIYFALYVSILSYSIWVFWTFEFCFVIDIENFDRLMCPFKYVEINMIFWFCLQLLLRRQPMWEVRKGR